MCLANALMGSPLPAVGVGWATAVSSSGSSSLKHFHRRERSFRARCVLGLASCCPDARSSATNCMNSCGGFFTKKEGMGGKF